MINRLIENSEKSSLRKEQLQFDIGDTVDVATRIIEGDKERIQIFSGVVIARRGRGINETFIVRRIVNNEGVERIFPSNSPNIASITVKRSGESRRSKLYYLRDRVGKAVRLTEKRKEKRDEAQSAGGAIKSKAESEKELAASAS
jgi:large subunit ribosomal protein L19